MLSAPIILFYIFLVIVVCAIGLAPTALWNRFGGSIAGAGQRARQQRAARQLAWATASSPFTADDDYVASGIGFAFDRSRGLFFIGSEDDDANSGTLVPLAALRAYHRGVLTGGFSDKNYVDLFAKDPEAPNWRISCGEDVVAANSIDRLLISLELPKT